MTIKFGFYEIHFDRNYSSIGVFYQGQHIANCEFIQESNTLVAYSAYDNRELSVIFCSNPFLAIQDLTESLENKIGGLYGFKR